MRLHELRREQRVRGDLDTAFAFFARAANLEAITPPWLRFRMLTPEPIEMRVGTVLDYRLRLHGLPLRWRSHIDVWEPGVAFVDRQLAGPYGFWHHRHEFAAAADGTLVRDVVHYALPAGRWGELTHALVRRDLERIFDYRRAAVERALEGSANPGAGADRPRDRRDG